MTIELSSIKTCFNCEYLATWYSSGNQYEPPDAGWNCSHKRNQELEFIGEDAASNSDSESGVFNAMQCPFYKFSSYTLEQCKETVEDSTHIVITHKIVENPETHQYELVDMPDKPGWYIAFYGTKEECKNHLLELPEE